MEQFLKSVETRSLRMLQIATGNSDDALDLMQDCMMKFVQAYKDKPKEQWKPLYYKIVQNRLKDWYRRTKVRSIIVKWIPGSTSSHTDDDFDILDTMEAPYSNVADDLESRQAIRKLVKHLRKLPPKQHQTFMLRAWEGLSVSETAIAMNCSNGTVKTHYARAVKKLRKTLEGVWP